MNSNSRYAHLARFAPDGLNEMAVNNLIADVDQSFEDAPAATSALVDGSAAARRRRRIQRRMLSAVVRSLPARRGVSRPAGEAA